MLMININILKSDIGNSQIKFFLERTQKDYSLLSSVSGYTFPQLFFDYTGPAIKDFPLKSPK